VSAAATVIHALVGTKYRKLPKLPKMFLLVFGTENLTLTENFLQKKFFSVNSATTCTHVTSFTDAQ